MTNSTTETLPASVVEAAIQIIENQGPTPITPGEIRPDGKISLCAAAALASAGLKLGGHFERLRQFEQELALQQSKDSIRRVFDELRWPAMLCERSMMKNDGLAAPVRRDGVIRYLRELSTC